MNISVNADHFCAVRGGKPRELSLVLKKLSSTGFEMIDILVDDNEIEKTSELLSKYNMTVNQSHCPFNRYSEKSYDDFSKDIMTAVKNTHALCSPILVIHGDEFDFHSQEYSFNNALEFNYRLFYPVAEYAAHNNIKIAFENLFEDCGKPRFGSKPDELTALVERFNSKHVGICLDTGHAHVADKEHYLSNIEQYADKVISTHIHDNFGTDKHMFPYMGEINLEECMRILKRHGYSGELTYEFVYDKIPTEALDAAFSYLIMCGNRLVNA